MNQVNSMSLGSEMLGMLDEEIYPGVWIIWDCFEDGSFLWWDLQIE